MFVNCISTAGYVRVFCRLSLALGVPNSPAYAHQVLTMRKRIKVTGFKDWDTMFYNNFLSIPVLVIFSFLVEDWSYENLEKNLCVTIWAT